MNDNDVFIGLYNRLDNLCRDEFSLPSRSTSAIVSLVEKLRRSEFYRYNELADDLDAIRMLRNSFIHSERLDGEELFTVSPKAIEKLREIIAVIENPLRAMDRAIPFISLFRVYGDELVLDVVKTMIQKGYSHVPLVDKKGHLLGVFSEGVIFSLLGKEGKVDANEKMKINSLQVFLPAFSHENERYAFFPRNALLEDVARAFRDSKAIYGKRLGMAFITENGKKDETILGALLQSSFYDRSDNA